ncbi:MAG: hypothetical protein CMC86_02790 [Flavobacteriaceae bacterium]|nr:hypothetical protein [Flavobacteriaceae bacterium]|tara:strand:+ start:3949 stop:4644 length:696 start_codon:yes stop_codon:yes gene_type:complete
MQKLYPVLLIIAVLGCNKTLIKNTTVNGIVKGLQKGTLYLQKFQDTAYVTIDSIFIKGEKEFQLTFNLEEPEMLYLGRSESFDTERIPFFAHVGTTTINTTLKRFSFDAKIDGGPQQKILEDYNANIKQFKNLDLELLENLLNAQLINDKAKIEQTKIQRAKNLERQYLYSINFAVNNKSSEIAPYIALADLYDAKKSYLDTIYNSLSPAIASSKYGMIFKDFIANLESVE